MAKQFGGQTTPAIVDAAGLAGAHAPLMVPTAADGMAIPFAVAEYNMAASVRKDVATATATYALPTLADHRTLKIHASTRTWFKTGTAGVTALLGDGCMVIEAGEKFHFRVTAGHTHIAVIADTAAGKINITPVV